MSRIERVLLALALCVTVASTMASAAPVGTSFTYQGRIEKNGAPYTGTCSLNLRLFDAVSSGTQVGSSIEVTGVTVTNGLFTAAPDFGGSAFNGEARWMDIQVKAQGDAVYTQLTPRQRITAAPYSLYSTAGTGGSSQWTTSGAGIEYQAGAVAVGATANSGTKLYVEAGTQDVNPLYIHSNNTSFAALAVQNDGTNGLGIYDAWSDRHYLGGRLGVGTLDPVGKIHAQSNSETAVVGIHTGSWVGVYGESQAYHGVHGNSITGTGVVGTSGGAYNAGVFGQSTNASGAGGWFKNTGGGVALLAEGLAKVGTLEVYGGADIVEGFETGEHAVAPGTVVVIDEKHPGELRASSRAYDRRVAGVVSGAGGVEPGLRLGQKGKMEGETPVAMSGRVYVQASAENGSIRPGDLLTTAELAGHAMRANDAARSHGAVLGKAMSGLERGTGLVLVLVNLQ